MCVQLSTGQYQLACKPASGGGEWQQHQAAKVSSPIIPCPGLSPGTRYTFRGRIGGRPAALRLQTEQSRLAQIQ